MLGKVGTAIRGTLVAAVALTLALSGCSDDDDKAECGDGVIEGDESCDDAELGGATCESLGFDGGDLACGDECSFDTSGCWDAECGDGVANGTEECDDADLAGTTCADLGYTGGDLSCDSTCSFDESGCVDTCGDDTLDSDYEVCDGSDFGTATCSSEGNFDGGSLSCSNDCQNILTTGCCSDQCTTDGALSCNGNILQRCELQPNGCLGFTETNCADDDQVCDDSGTPMCTDACTSDCSTQGETYCEGTELWTCESVSTCLVWNNTDCAASSEVCFGDPAACVAPEGNCDVPFYLETVQLANGTWDGTAVGDTSTTDATNHVDAASCDGGSAGDANDWIYAIDVPAADLDATVVMTPNPDFDAVLRLLATPCDLGTEVVDPSDPHRDGCADGAYSGAETLHLINLPAGRYYVVADGYEAGQEEAFHLRVTYAPTTCGNGVLDLHETCDDGNLTAGDGCSPRCAPEPAWYCDGSEPSVCEAALAPSAEGDLVITEILQNPGAVQDSDGEWFEIYNPTSDPLNLYDLEVSDADNDAFTVDATVVVPPGGYAVLGRNADRATNGGVRLDYEWPSGGMALGNGSDEVILTYASTEIDRVEYDNGATFPDPTGASMSLDPASLSHTDNDAGANWCATRLFAYGTLDLGTPGAANMGCGTVTDVFAEDDLESDPGWSVAGDWAWGTPDSSYADGPASCAGGSSCYGTNLSGAYSSDTGYDTNYLELGPVDLSAASGSTILLVFDLWLAVDYAHDFARLEYSTDGSTYQPLAVQHPPYNDIDHDQWTGTTGGWTTATADLTAHASESTFSLRFALDSDASIEEAGFYVDNLSIVTY